MVQRKPGRASSPSPRRGLTPRREREREKRKGGRREGRGEVWVGGRANDKRGETEWSHRAHLSRADFSHPVVFSHPHSGTVSNRPPVLCSRKQPLMESLHQQSLFRGFSWTPRVCTQAGVLGTLGAGPAQPLALGPRCPLLSPPAGGSTSRRSRPRGIWRLCRLERMSRLSSSSFSGSRVPQGCWCLRVPGLH